MTEAYLRRDHRLQRRCFNGHSATRQRDRTDRRSTARPKGYAHRGNHQRRPDEMAGFQRLQQACAGRDRHRTIQVHHRWRLQARPFRAQQTEVAIGRAVLNRMPACTRPKSARRNRADAWTTPSKTSFCPSLYPCTKVQLAPSLAPGDVVVLDNLNGHCKLIEQNRRQQLWTDKATRRVAWNGAGPGGSFRNLERKAHLNRTGGMAKSSSFIDIIRTVYSRLHALPLMMQSSQEPQRSERNAVRARRDRSASRA